MSESIIRNLGVVTAYRYAQMGGYTGTEEQFQALLANVDTYSAEATAAASSVASTVATVESYATRAETAVGLAEGSADSAADAADDAEAYATTATTKAGEASASAAAAATSATTASGAAAAAGVSETNAALSEQNAAASESNAGASETAAASSASAAATSKADAQTSATNAAGSATAAATSASEALASANSARSSMNDATSARTDAVEAAAAAAQSELNAETSEIAAEGYRDEAQSYAIGTSGEVRQGDATDNAKYYKEQAALSASASAGSATSAASSASAAAGSAGDAEDLVTQALTIIANADEAVEACEHVEENLALKLDKANVTQSHLINTSGYAIDAREANPDISGTLAYQVEHVMDALPFAFGVENGTYGYIKEGESTVTPFRNPTGDAVAANVLSGKTFANASSDSLTGAMPNRGTISAELACGESYTVQQGYHSGSGTVTAKSLASQTAVDMYNGAAAGDILSGKQAWVSGTKITGTMTDRGTITQTLSAGGSYTIPAGKHSGSGTVTAKTLASQTAPDSGYTAASAAAVRSGYQAWVNGSKVTGSMATLSSSNFTGAYDTSASKYVVKSTAAGYIASNTTVNWLTAGTSNTIATTAATGTQTIDCGLGLYNKIKVNQTPAYNAGYSSGFGDGKLMTVYHLPTNQDGSSGASNATVTKKLPSGSYTLLIMIDSGLSLDSQTVTLTIGSTTRTYHAKTNSSGDIQDKPSTGKGTVTLMSGRVLFYWSDTFSADGSTNVTLSLSDTGGSYINRPTIATIY